MKLTTFKGKIALFLFLGLLLLSLGINGVLFLKAKQYYWELNGTRLDPLGLRVYPTNRGAIKEEGVLTAVNQQIHSKASQNVLILDSYDLLVDDRGLLNPQFAYDELHLNEAGYTMLNEALAQLLP